jgi:hypothetical protein
VIAMTRRSRSKKTKSNDVRTGILLAILGVVMLSLLVGGLWWVKHTKIVLDQVTNCPQKGPRAVHVIIFDRTDPITPLQGQRVRQKMNELRDTATFGKRFDIYTVEGDAKNVLSPVLTICSPNRPEDANEIIENPKSVKDRYEQRFVAVLEKAIDDLLGESTRETSPIIESMKAAAIASFGPFERQGISFRMTIISDMIQNTPANRQFKTEPNFPQLARSPAWPSLRPNLFGAEVDILYLLRPGAQRPGSGPIQNRGHQEFWAQLISASNGRLASGSPVFEPI